MPNRMMTLTRLFVLGVALGLALTDQSEQGLSSEEQLEATGLRKGQLEAPEVVLQLKYDRGELNRIYLAQFRQGKGVWAPSVQAKNNLCADLCRAGLGGEACGPTCEALTPAGLRSALSNASLGSGERYGEPRVDVCPSLCDNQLGQPLCNCVKKTEDMSDVNWDAICTSFCESDNYVLRGCPSCKETAAKPDYSLTTSSRNLRTVEGWSAWCNVQCRQGHGGAACNCDRSPL